jgi:hypothetical protein
MSDTYFRKRARGSGYMLFVGSNIEDVAIAWSFPRCNMRVGDASDISCLLYNCNRDNNRTARLEVRYKVQRVRTN